MVLMTNMPLPLVAPALTVVLSGVSLGVAGEHLLSEGGSGGRAMFWIHAVATAIFVIALAAAMLSDPGALPDARRGAKPTQGEY
jgi:hypothetical protein